MGSEMCIRDRLMQVGDLVKYKTPTPEFRVGMVIKILPKAERDDNILVLWNGERAWCVAEHWIEHVA